MPNYAIKDGSVIVNVIVADTKEIAESVTSLEAIEVTEEQPIGIGWTLINDEWQIPESLLNVIPSEESIETVA